MNTKAMSQFDVLEDKKLATVEGGVTGVLEAIGIGIGIGWGIYSFGEAAGRAYYDNYTSKKEVTNMEKNLFFKISLLISFLLTVGGLLLTLYNYFFFNYPFLNQTTVGLIVSFLIVSLIFFSSHHRNRN